MSLCRRRDVFGRLLAGVGLRFDRQRAGVASSGPGGQQQQDPRVCASRDGVSFARVELDEQPGAAGDLLAGGCRDLHVAFDDGDPGAFVDLMVLHRFAGGDLDHDRSCVVGGREDLRRVRAQLQRADVPGLHGALRSPSHR